MRIASLFLSLVVASAWGQSPPGVPLSISGPVKTVTIVEAVPQLIASATLHVDTSGAGFTDITENAASFVVQAAAGDGVLMVYLRHTSASLTIQENADPDVQTDLVAALDHEVGQLIAIDVVGAELFVALSAEAAERRGQSDRRSQRE